MGDASRALRGRAVLVTGASGFIGSHLVRRLVAGGAGRVLALDRRERAAELPAGVEFIQHALGFDAPEPLDGVLRGIERVFHLAAEKHSQARPDPTAVLRANFVGTQELVEAAVRAGVRKAVFSSSVYAYGRAAAPALSEDEPARPTTAYGLSKLAAEQSLEAARHDHGLGSATLRYFFVYGPGMHRSLGYRSVIPKNLERLRRGEAATVFGDGEQALDYVFIEDVVEATLRAAESDVSGVLNVGSGQPTTINRLMDALIAVTGSGAGKTHLPPDTTAGTYRVASVEKIGRLLGWSPRIGLEEGLARTYAAIAQEKLA